MPAKDELPSTLQRSSEKAQRTWIKAHDSAVETYGEGERAHRVAYAALKHSFEKVGDHWEPKEAQGPSDPQAANPRAGRGADVDTAEGVDVTASKKLHDDEGGAGGGIAAGEPGPYPPGPAVTWTAPAGQRAWPRGPVTGGGRRGGLYTLRVLRRW